MNKIAKNEPAEALLPELRTLIDGARQRAAVAVNSELVTLYWHIGKRIGTEVLANERARYGKGVIKNIGRDLSRDYGRSFSARNLHYMVRFAECFQDIEKVNALRAHLSWTHFRELLAMDDPLRSALFSPALARPGRH